MPSSPLPVLLQLPPNWSPSYLDPSQSLLHTGAKVIFPKTYIRRYCSCAHTPTLVPHFTHNRIQNFYSGFQDPVWTGPLFISGFLTYHLPQASHGSHPGPSLGRRQPSSLPTQDLCTRYPSYWNGLLQVPYNFSTLFVQIFSQYHYFEKLKVALLPFPAFFLCTVHTILCRSQHVYLLLLV